MLMRGDALTEDGSNSDPTADLRWESPEEAFTASLLASMFRLAA